MAYFLFEFMQPAIIVVINATANLWVLMLSIKIIEKGSIAHIMISQAIYCNDWSVVAQTRPPLSLPCFKRYFLQLLHSFTFCTS